MLQLFVLYPYLGETSTFLGLKYHSICLPPVINIESRAELTSLGSLLSSKSISIFHFIAMPDNQQALMQVHHYLQTKDRVQIVVIVL